MRYDIETKTSPASEPFWNLGVTLLGDQTPAEYVEMMASLGVEILTIRPSASQIPPARPDDINDLLRARHGNRAVQLVKGNQAVRWSIDDHGGVGIDGLLNEGWRISDYIGKRVPGPPQHHYLWGGWLIDGHPLNVITGLGWIDGQIEIITPYVAAGELPDPFLMRRVAPVPADILSPAEIDLLNTALGETAQGVRRDVTAGPNGIGTAGLVLAGGVGLAALLAAKLL